MTVKREFATAATGVCPDELVEILVELLEDDLPGGSGRSGDLRSLASGVTNVNRNGSHE
jgi:hypothetical protein